MPKQTNDTPMRLIEGVGLKMCEITFGKGANRVVRTFAAGKTTMVPNQCVRATLKTKIVEEVPNAK